MDVRFITMFKEIAHNTYLLANRVSKSDYKNKTEESDKVAEIIRDDYTELYERLNTENFDPTSLTRQDFAKLLVGTSILVGNLQNQVDSLQKAVNDYKTVIIPALQAIFEKTEDDAAAIALAEHFFTITPDQEDNIENSEETNN